MKQNRALSIITCTTLFFVTLSLFAQNTWYVDASRPNDAGPGDAPATAWRIIQTAMDNSNLSDGDTILVAPGIYDQGGTQTAANATNRVFFTKNNLVLKAISTNPADTVIMGGPDPDTVDGFGTNAVRGVWLRAGGQLIGFTVKNGYSAIGNQGRAGGIVLLSGCIVSNCVITGNNAQSRGGGVSPARNNHGGRVYNSIIENNFVPGTSGAGVCSEGSTYDPIIVINSIIKNNTNHSPTASGTASSYGAASGSILINCLLEGNVASSGGDSPRPSAGAAYYCTLINCVVVGNSNQPSARFSSAALNGGTAINTTIVGNSDGNGYGSVTSVTKLYNCIVWGNYRDGVYNVNFTTFPAAVEYSCAPELTHGVDGNITNNPVFISEVEFNVRPTGPARASPCINTGNNTFIEDAIAQYPEAAFDRDGNPRILENVVDMGAYEYKPPPPGFVFKFF